MTRKEAIEYAKNRTKKFVDERNSLGHTTNNKKAELQKEIDFLQLAIINMQLAEEFQLKSEVRGII